jgi:hypothetical protein
MRQDQVLIDPNVIVINYDELAMHLTSTGQTSSDAFAVY